MFSELFLYGCWHWLPNKPCFSSLLCTSGSRRPSCLTQSFPVALEAQGESSICCPAKKGRAFKMCVFATLGAPTFGTSVCPRGKSNPRTGGCNIGHTKLMTIAPRVENHILGSRKGTTRLSCITMASTMFTGSLDHGPRSNLMCSGVVGLKAFIYIYIY